MTKHKIHPPKLGQRILMRVLREELAEEVLGDLDENFFQTLRGKSPLRAKINYWYQVLHYLRPFALRKSKFRYPNHFDMYQAYLKTGWRNLRKQKMYSVIKIGGFALGIAACLLIALFIKDELSYDRHYPDGDRLFRVMIEVNLDGETIRDIWFQAPFAVALKEDYPDIEMVGRLNPVPLFGAGANEIRRGDRLENIYEEGFAYADQEWLDMLQIPMVYGSREHALAEPRSIVISRRKAEKYFPNEDPVGKILILNNNDDRTYKIGGVMENFPSNSHLQYDFLLTMTGQEFYPGEQTNWRATNYPTYVKLRKGVNKEELEKKLYNIVTKYWLPVQLEAGRVDSRELAKKISYRLQPISDIYLNEAGVEDDRLSHGDIRYVWLFGAIAVFILIIACINFVNLSTAKSANRAKEVGLRKVVGSLRSQLVGQFLAESLLFSLFSFASGILLAWMLLPYFNMLAGKELFLPLEAWWFLPLILVATLLIGILAGLYPSFYLSAFRPIQVLKGNLSRGSKTSSLRNVLVVVQFATSIILIISTVVVYRQMDFILNRKVGFEKDQILLIQGTNTIGDGVTVLKKELQQLPEVKAVSISDYLPVAGTVRNGNPFWKEGTTTTEKSVGGQRWVVDHDYIKTMGMNIVEGRDFSVEMASDSQAVIINQEMAKQLGLSKPVGERITNGTIYTVIGVVENFHFESMKEAIGPLALVLGRSQSIVSVKANSTDMSSLMENAAKVWKKIAPHQPVRFAFMDDNFARMYSDVERTGRIFTSFAVLAIVVACLGLFALSAFIVEQRSKEISIRLVLGASVKSIFHLLTRNFVILILISLILATPVAWYIMKKWLEDYTYKTDLTWDIFLIAGLIIFGIAMITISYQSIRAALASPVDSLKAD